MKNINEILKNKLKDHLLHTRKSSSDMPSYTVDKHKLGEVISILKENDARFITMVGTDERANENYFGLYYVFAFDQTAELVTIHIDIEEEDSSFPSVTNLLPNCNWYEREVHDLLGLIPEGHPQLAALILHDDWPEGAYPLRKDYSLEQMQRREESQNWFQTEYIGEGITEIPVGPIHAGIIEPGHFSFGVAGDAILHLDAQLFFKHRGLEKRSEGMTLQEGVLLAERICGMCAVSHAVAYSMAIEKMSDTKVPLRAQQLRMIYLELERLYNHIGDIGDICSGAGFHIGTSHGARLKECLHQLNEQLVGNRFLRGTICLGGVSVDLAAHELDYLRNRLMEIRWDFRDVINIILDHEITTERMKTTGILPKRIAESLEVVGPAGRASGREIDVRKSHPYLQYKQFDFSVPTYKNGDVLARFQVRIDEVFTSFELILQLIEFLEEGDIATEIGFIKPFSFAVGMTESALGENVHWLMVNDAQTIERYRIRSAAYHNWQAVPASVKGNIVPDFPIINKSFELCYACCDR